MNDNRQYMGDLITVYTDGGFRWGPRMGTWAYVVVPKENKDPVTDCGWAFYTTHNRMEFMAIIAALRSFKTPSNILIISDSQYAINSLNYWNTRIHLIEGRDNCANKDLITDAVTEMRRHQLVEYKWVRGHNGNKYNEIADILTQEAFAEANEEYKEMLIEEYIIDQKIISRRDHVGI